MSSFVIKLFSLSSDEFVGQEVIDAKSESAALGRVKKLLKEGGIDASEYRFEITQEQEVQAPVEAVTDDTPVADTIDKVEAKKEEEPKRVVLLDPANGPLGMGEAPRKYPQSIKTDLGTFWGCDQQKLLGSIRLNADKLDGFRVTHTGSRTNFYIDGTLIWTSTKPVAAVAEQMALELITALSA
jgi:hypothetical protein